MRLRIASIHSAAANAACALLVAFALTGTACARLAQVTAPPDAQEAHAKARATSLFDQFASGKVDRSDFTPQMDKAMTPAMVGQVQPQFETLGTIQNLTLLTKNTTPGGTSYVFDATFSGGDHKVEIFLTPEGKVGGYRVLP